MIQTLTRLIEYLLIVICFIPACRKVNHSRDEENGSDLSPGESADEDTGSDMGTDTGMDTDTDTDTDTGSEPDTDSDRHQQPVAFVMKNETDAPVYLSGETLHLALYLFDDFYHSWYPLDDEANSCLSDCASVEYGSECCIADCDVPPPSVSQVPSGGTAEYTWQGLTYGVTDYHCSDCSCTRVYDPMPGIYRAEICYGSSWECSGDTCDPAPDELGVIREAAIAGDLICHYVAFELDYSGEDITVAIADTADLLSDADVISAAESLDAACYAVNNLEEEPCAALTGDWGCNFWPEDLQGVAVDKSELISCLEAREARLDCALALSCHDFEAWWNGENSSLCAEEGENEILACPWRGPVF